MKNHLTTLSFPALMLFAFLLLPAFQNRPAAEVNYPPVSTFESRCARCHGPHGSFYGESFGKLPEEELKRFVGDMMKGPARLKPNESDIEAMTAYNRALARNMPFIYISSVISTGKGMIYSGESIPGTKLSISGSKKNMQITADNNGNWQTAPVPGSAPVVFEAVFKNNTVKLIPSGAKWSW